MQPKLFVAIYSDEDVNPTLARALRARGYEAQSYLDVGFVSKDDDLHFTYATQNGFAMMTRNRDEFIAMADDMLARGDQHYGLIIATHYMRFAELLRRTLAFLDTVSADEAMNRTFYLSNFG